MDTIQGAAARRRGTDNLFARLVSGAVAATLAAASLVGLGLIGATVSAPPADAAVYDATTYPLKFVSANRVAISPAGNTGLNANDIVKYKGVTTIDGVVIDAVVKVVSLDSGGSITKLDDGSALSANPPTSPQTVGDLLLTDIGTTGVLSSVLLEFSFYEGGTYTGVGSGIPVTLANARVSAYDIDAVSSVKQYVDLRGFQSYSVYTGAAPNGIAVSNQPNGMVRFAANTTAAAAATSGSYSWARVQVNYDRTTTLQVRLGALGSGGAFHALDFSAGGIWTTDGTTVVVPTTTNNPNNSAPVTADVSLLNATINSHTVLATSDFPYTDADDNFFAAVKIVTAPSASSANLEYFNGTSWVAVADGFVITTTDIDLGKLRLSPIAATGSFTFAVYDGLVYSTTKTFSFSSPANGQTITFANPGTRSPSVSFASGATASSGLTPTLTSLTPAVCTVSGLSITTVALPSGVTTATCLITASQAGDATYGRADAVTQQFSVSSLLAQTISFANPGDQAFSASPIATGAVAAPSGLTVTLNSLTPGVCTVSGLNILPVTQGLCSVRAAQAGNGSYAPASPVTQTFTLLAAAQTITFAQPADQLINGGPLVVAPTASSSLTPVLTSSTPAVCTVSSFSVAFVSTGACSLTANQAGNSTYAAASPVTRSFNITLVSQTVTFAQPADQLVNGGPLVLAPTASSGLTPVLTSSTTGVCTVSSFTVTFLSTGVCTLTANQAGNATYAAAPPISHSFAINQVSQSITFTQPADQLMNGGPLVLAPTATSGLAPVLASSTSGVCTVSGTTVSFVSAGVCTILADQAGNATFAAAPTVSRSFAVNQVSQSITFTQPSGQLINGGPLVLAPTATSGLTPVLTSSSTGVCTVSGMTVTFVGVGACTILADQAGNATFAGAPTVSRSFAINQVSQSITFAQPADQLMDDGSLIASPTASSGLTPALSSSTTAVCTVSGMTVSFVSAGLCTITASQSGNATYSAAAPVSQSFTIDQVSQTTTFSQPATQLMNGGPLVLAPTATSGLTPVLTSSTPAVCTVSGVTVTFVSAGVCTITANQAGNATYTAAAPISRSFDIVQVSQFITFAQPADQSIGGGPLVVAPTSDSGLVPTLSSSTTGVCTVSGMAITFVSTGLCTVTADQPGNAVFAAAAPVDRSFAIGFVSQTITFPQPTDASLDDATVLLTVTTNAAGLTPTLSSGTPAVCTVTGMTVTFVGPGVCTVTANQSGNATYAAAPPITHSFQVMDIETDTLDPMRAGQPFTQQLTVLGAVGGGVWSTTSPLPPGLTLDPTTGVLSGTPTGPLSQLMTFAYTEGGVVSDISLQLDIAAELSPLAFTGTDAIGALTVAVLLLLLGGIAIVIAVLQRRRRVSH